VVRRVEEGGLAQRTRDAEPWVEYVIVLEPRTSPGRGVGKDEAATMTAERGALRDYIGALCGASATSVAALLHFMNAARSRPFCRHRRRYYVVTSMSRARACHQRHVAPTTTSAATA
jgi:hypothetical protein